MYESHAGCQFPYSSVRPRMTHRRTAILGPATRHVARPKRNIKTKHSTQSLEAALDLFAFIFLFYTAENYASVSMTSTLTASSWQPTRRSTDARPIMIVLKSFTVRSTQRESRLLHHIKGQWCSGNLKLKPHTTPMPSICEIICLYISFQWEFERTSFFSNDSGPPHHSDDDQFLTARCRNIILKSVTPPQITKNKRKKKMCENIFRKTHFNSVYYTNCLDIFYYGYNTFTRS